MRRWGTVVVALAVVAAGMVATAEPEADAAEAHCADATAAPFADRERIASVHRAAVDCLWHLGIVQGRHDDEGRLHFAPRTPVTRAQFAGMLHRLLDRDGAGLPAPRRPRFTDVPEGHVFDEQVHTLAAAGVIAGIDHDRFEPSRAVRRDEAASLVVRGVGHATDGPLVPAAGPWFWDVRGGVHREAVDAGFEHRLVDGVRRPCEDRLGQFLPTRSAERQQAASMLVRVLEVVDEVSAGAGGDRRADPECPEPVWLPSLDEAREFVASRAGSASFAAVGTDGALVGHRAATQVSIASVLKVMYLVAYLRQPDVRDRALRQADRDLLEPMIRHSANEPATRIANRLGPGPIEALAERAGMRDFSYTRPWGATQTSARDQARFMADLHTHLPARHRAYALGLLTEVVEEQRWGVGEVAVPGWTAHFKGGWGSGTGAVNHQVVRLRHDATGTVVAVAVMTTNSPSHDYGSNTLRGAFRRLLADLPA